jgi:hypothetical protein
MNTKEEAQQGMEQLVKALVETVGGPWLGRVWENLGWHYEAHIDHVSVYPVSGGYFCLICQNHGYAAGEIYWSVDRKAPLAVTPKDAFDAAFNEVKKFVAQVIEVQNEIEASVGIKVEHSCGSIFGKDK